MHIVIDARMVSSLKFGISRYVCNLLKALADIDRDNGYTILVQNDFLVKEVNAPNFKFKHTRIKWLSIHEQLLLPFLLKKLKPDVFHATSFVVPLFQSYRTVITIHDLIHLLFPEDHGLKQRVYYQFVVKNALKSASKIIAVSKSTKNDLISHFKISPEKIKVVYEAAGSTFRPILDMKLIDSFKKGYNLPDNYILYVGNRKKHKNLETLFEAFKVFKKDDKENYSLVLTGSGKSEGGIHFVGNISDDALPLLYNAAKLFVFPSLYEGFGLPPLEAMACGTPVITSNASSLPEVVAEGGLTIDPMNLKDFAGAIGKALSNQDLNQDLRKRGIERAKRFSWEKCAQETLEIYRQA